VALLDSEQKILELAEVADVVYWPVAMDFKRADLEDLAPGSVDIGLFNGVIRTSEHERDAVLMRERCRVLIAFGSCAAFGGIPGLANLSRPDEILDTVYSETPSTENPDAVLPATATVLEGITLELPAFSESVRALHQVVGVDYLVPGCPPPHQQVIDTLDTVIEYSRSGTLPMPGAVFASDKALCDECERIDTRSARRISSFERTHQIAPDPGICFLEQGILCMGIATRGGCGSLCIGANSPCRGCFGPTDHALDPGAEALSTLGSLAGFEHEDDLPTNRRLQPSRSMVDLAGTLYRFTLPIAAVPGRVDDETTDQEA
jgi:F420-non-reducing hydrogenase small subunit